MLTAFLRNHVLANLAFGLVLVVGFLAYGQLLPREKDPEINFNWVNITTVFPGASASDVETRVTDILEEGLENLQDVKFVSSYSRDSLSTILVRFESIDERTFDRRMNDLRREIQSQEKELPPEVEDPEILEVTTSNAFPTATVVVVGEADDENLRRQARLVERDLERIAGVDRVDPSGLHDPELLVHFWPERLSGARLDPVDLADTVAAYFSDLAAGRVRMGAEEWSVRLLGTSENPGYLANLPVITTAGEVPLDTLAQVARGREDATRLVRFEGKPAVLLAVIKKAHANTLDLVERIHDYIDQRNALSHAAGVRLVLADDQTVSTRKAIDVMQSNAVVGLLLVFLVSWAFLGSRIAFLTTLGIPFALAGTFWVLSSIGQSLNTNVLLGVVIALGMLVDDAVVVVESIYYRLVRGVDALTATIESLREVFAPVTASVLTTVAAFLPLMLLPGILGEFMKVIPMVVTIALFISLVEAYWMLPAHVIALGHSARPSRLHNLRWRFTHWIRVGYSRLLIKAMRRPRLTLILGVALIVAAVLVVAKGYVFVNFFALETYRLFYVNVEMPPGTALDKTIDTAVAVERAVRSRLEPGDARSVVTYAGQMFTETEPLFGDHLAQIMVSLNPKTPELREVDAVVADVRPVLGAVAGPARVWLLPLKDGPPAGKAISMKVRGDDYGELRAATDALRGILATMPALSDVSDDAALGPMELKLRLDTDAIRRAGLNPARVARVLRLLADGEVVASMQYEGDELDVRVRARPETLNDIDALLRESIPLPNGDEIAFGDLVDQEIERGLGAIRHYNFRRTITVEAELDKTRQNVVAANEEVRREWEAIAARYPNVSLDFSGELDDIQESMDAIGVLFLFGVGLIYLILGTQFRSYFQPFMILITVPMAFAGVVLGLLITGHPLSLFTLYGVVALAGIAVNSAIVLIAAANDRLELGMSLLHATIYAARRRVIPILITALTNLAGLFSLATGLGGESLLWGPVATAIVWGLGFSTVLTLFVVPVLYRLSMGRRARRTQPDQAASPVISAP